ncbi:hypothetical protein WBP07_02005 [Novosphingobium sp. BL-8A]|uniref:hypothetical protein n=1 Tax=Novosphingobium sp. BL-8A TaxID=3127639 RepID=UPI003757C61E
MLPHTRAMVAATAYAFITGRKVAGLHDHSTGRDVRIAAESRGDQVQGIDGDRSAKFGGTLPEIYDAGERAHVSFEIDGTKAQGYDRASSGFYTAQVSGQRVQLYDHDESVWFTFSVQDMETTIDAPAGTEANH